MSTEPSPADAFGLSPEEAARRLADEGPNALPQQGHRSVPAIALDVLREPMLLLLVLGGLVYVLFGDLLESAVLLVLATLSIAITVVQETRTERVLESLRDLTSPRALVVRGGERQRIAGRDVVRGDLMVIGEGDRVPADARLIEATDIQVDESLLTGEAVPVRKTLGGPVSARPGGDDSPIVYSGTLIVRGTGLAEVIATGTRTEIGRIGLSLSRLDPEPPRLKVQTARLVRLFGLLGLAVTALAVVLYGLLRGDWLEAGLAGIALGMTMLPEEFPVVLTVFMAMGAWRISKARVLTRRAASIESLGAATVLCTDKTGTLTENRMRVAELRVDGAALDPAGEDPRIGRLARVGLLASADNSFDPMDIAFAELAEALGTADRAGLAPDRTFGLRTDLLAVTRVWRVADGREGAPGDAPVRIAAAKGAPEAIAALCAMAPETLREMHAAAAAMAGRGMRVVGLATADLGAGAEPHSAREIPFSFAGLAGLADPLRASVPDAVRECQGAGVRVVMITGDYPVTAESIARQAGISGDGTMTGDDLARLDGGDHADAVARAAIFARVMPEQKLRIVESLKAAGEVVAMTGDGVNDAPSLRAAHIGVAMGERGTDVAREAAAIVLLDDDFGSIVRAIRLGRRIYDNLRKAMGFILAVHLPIAGLALLPLVMGMPIVFWPVHIAFIEMVVDPVCTLVFEAEDEEPDIMRRPPRPPDAPLFSRGLILWSVVQGLSAFAAVAAVYLAGIGAGMAEDSLRAVAFLTLILSIVVLILVNRSFSASPLRAVLRPNRSLAVVMASVAAALVAALALPEAAALFRFGAIGWREVAVAAATALALLLALEAMKAVAFRLARPGR